ncbi:alpha/beta hydrolase [Spongiivirga sp. MCCC 1A20706]|uniref:alpha/beta fold hydrolase n=1 Tax=Spongiivirga sp. MCCC 1A20706 TaxID=3160963 RepID=UPI00397771D0
MKKLSSTYIATLILLFVVICYSSCSNDDSLNNLSETIYVRHKNADMPAHIHGNATNKIFLITLHGGPGGLGLGMRYPSFINRIEPNYAVVYFDQRGAGMAQGSYAEEDVSIELLGEDIIALKNVLKAKYGQDSRFFLMGHSYGGTVGTAALLKSQEDFLGWIEVGGSNHPYGVYFANIENHVRVADEQIALGNSVAYWESVKQLVSEVDNTTRNQEDFNKLNSEAGFAQEKLEADGVINRPTNQSDVFFDYNLLTALWNIYQIQSIEQDYFGDFNLNDQISEITIPTLLLWGKYDMVVPPSLGVTAFENIGSTDKELFIFERSGHSPMEHEPLLFTDTVLEFMNRNK